MKLLIIDGNNTMHRAYHSYRMLQNNGKPVAVIYGMPNLVHALINQFKPDHTVICWDWGRSKHRLKLLPEYKEGRKTLTEEQRADLYNQRDKAMAIFQALGINQLYSKGHEADDYIYALVRKNREANITIVSTDKDFHQLLSPKVKIFNTAKRLLIHEKNVKGHFGYTADQCVDYLCLLGDDSDNIPGYRGIGEQRAKIFLAEHSSIREFLASEKSFMKVDKAELGAIYKRNKRLIDLRVFYNRYLKGNMDVKPALKKKPLNKKALFKICDEYNIKSFKKKSFLKIYQ